MSIYRRSITLVLSILFLLAHLTSAQVSSTAVDTDVGVPASDVGVAASDVGVPASDVGVAASDVGVAATQALPPQFSDDEEIYHVAGNVVSTSTDIKILTPTAATQWTSNATNMVTWTGTTPERFSIQLINDDTSILASGMSLRASVQTSDGSATCDVPAVKDSAGYYIRLYDQLDVSVTIATSDKFSVLKTPTATASTTTTSSNGTSSVPTKNEQGNGTATHATSAKANGAILNNVFSMRDQAVPSFVSALLLLPALTIW